MPHPIDVLVGTNIRLTRTARGLSQQQLSKSLDISFQQIQKYEQGTNRISASRLWEIADALGVDIPYFFDGANIENREQSPELPDHTIKLAGQINKIQNDAVRSQIVSLIKACAN